ncbi:SDR family NAD(P)-dependent oxidoreductase [Jatrophihabitans sp. DSM 45814]
MDIADRVAIVTGAGSGLGRVIAGRLSDAGAFVVAADLDPTLAADASAAMAPSEPAVSDISTDQGREHVLAVAMRHGGPHILVNNAGGWGPADRQFPQATAQQWRAVLELNLIAPMDLTQRCLDPMTRLGGGVVVNIASSGGRGFDAYSSPEYGAAKAGLIRFTSSVTDLSKTHHVRVNCVVPDWIGLDRAHAQLATMSAAQRARTPPLIPPDDIASTVLELIRDDKACGQVIVLDGGSPPRRLTD